MVNEEKLVGVEYKDKKFYIRKLTGSYFYLQIINNKIFYSGYHLIINTNL